MTPQLRAHRLRRERIFVSNANSPSLRIAERVRVACSRLYPVSLQNTAISRSPQIGERATTALIHPLNLDRQLAPRCL